MIIAAVFIYWFVGFCYIQALPKIGFNNEWFGDMFIAIVWPYLFLTRLFKHRVYLAEMKRKKAFRGKE